MNLNDIRNLYFIGIGGIGMSALARYFRQRGVEIHGYDRSRTPLTQALEDEGMHIHYTEDVSLIPAGVDLVVYTPAVPVTHLEYQYFLQHGTPIKKRAEVLGIISKGMRTIAVAGTHGKTTTSSMTTHLLRAGGLDCTAFLGGIARNLGSNYVLGTSDWVVVEADEFDRSFLHLHPNLVAILSMDADHLDIYGDLETLRETGFFAFARQLKTGGHLWVADRLKPDFAGRIPAHTFGVDRGEYQAANVRVEDGYFVFDYHNPEIQLPGLRLPMAGRHNVENATVAISIALALGVSGPAIREGLLAFRGVQRRIELIYRDANTAYYDDYAHHPTELRAVISAARELYPERKITGVFQPHLFSRTRDFMSEFAAALDLLDEAILLPIYPARELPIPGITSEQVMNLMNLADKRLLDKTELLEHLANHPPDILLTMGAGDIDTLVPRIAELLAQKNTISHE
ncbi:MAG: UDP-N-acetylmuramate--L-alanine ligase [Lewinellaceae bacterium]|nr:UDP-N-acetylmuramate--L-alanine ligase [Lewinellaceae bacterium]